MQFYNSPHLVSRDGGQSWRWGVVQGQNPSTPATVAMSSSPVVPGLWFATFIRQSSGGYSGGGVSTDGGIAWEANNDWVGWSLIAPSNNVNRVFVAGASSTLYESMDRGKAFSEVEKFDSDIVAMDSSSDGKSIWIALENSKMYSLDISTEKIRTNPIANNHVQRVSQFSRDPYNPSAMLVISDGGAVWYHRLVAESSSD
ncbi:MAG: hypothetical protein IT306_19205 [Chloroflexi bacterium]|nr:hypothetical protein [Chloroflexota bacterium]